MALNTSKCNHLTPLHFKGLRSEQWKSVCNCEWVNSYLKTWMLAVSATAHQMSVCVTHIADTMPTMSVFSSCQSNDMTVIRPSLFCYGSLLLPTVLDRNTCNFLGQFCRMSLQQSHTIKLHMLRLSSCTLRLCRINKASFRIIQWAAASSRPTVLFPSWRN